MLKGLVISSGGTKKLEKTLEEAGLPFVLQAGRSPADFLISAGEMGALPGELLALVDTDEAEASALKAGLICIGYLNPEKARQELWGCRVLMESLDGVDTALLTNIHTRALGLPVTIAETPRLVIREMTLDDPFEEDKEKAGAYIECMYGLYQFGMWTMVEKDSGRVIGRAGFGIADYLGTPEVDFGYTVEEPFRRRGYAFEACLEVLRYAAEVLEFEETAAYIEEGNEASLRLIEKLGFHRTDSFEYEGKRMYRYAVELSEYSKLYKKYEQMTQK